MKYSHIAKQTFYSIVYTDVCDTNRARLLFASWAKSITVAIGWYSFPIDITAWTVLLLLTWSSSHLHCEESGHRLNITYLSKSIFTITIIDRVSESLRVSDHSFRKMNPIFSSICTFYYLFLNAHFVRKKVKFKMLVDSFPWGLNDFIGTDEVWLLDFFLKPYFEKHMYISTYWRFISMKGLGNVLHDIAVRFKRENNNKMRGLTCTYYTYIGTYKYIVIEM